MRRSIIVKIAILSDIHGNMPALEAVFEDIRLRKIDEIVCLGDLVGKGPEPAEVIEFVKEHCDVVIRGNWDEFILNESEHDSIQWQQSYLSEDNKNYLNHLPFSYEFMLGEKFIRCVHASPRSVHERISPFQPLEKQETLFENSEITKNICGERTPDYFIYGDIHYACVKPIDGKGILVNVGSVGNPLEIPEASYGIIEHVGNSVSVQLVRVPYDKEAVLQKAKDVEMPNIEVYEAEIMNCIYRGQQKKEAQTT